MRMHSVGKWMFLVAIMLFAWNLWRTLDTSATQPSEAAARKPVAAGISNRREELVHG